MCGKGDHFLSYFPCSDRDFTADDYEALCRLDENVENRKGATRAEINALPTEVSICCCAQSRGFEKLAKEAVRVGLDMHKSHF